MDGQLSQLNQLDLVTPTKPLPVEVVGSAAGTPGAVRLIVRLSPDSWRRVVDEQLFHLDPASMGTSWANDADLTQPVDVQLGLERGVAYSIDGADIERQLADDPDDEILDSDNWYALDVHQELALPKEFANKKASLRTGFRTAWADSPLVGGGGMALIDVVESFFNERELPFERVEDQTIVKAVGSGANGDWTVWIEAREDDGIVLVWSSYAEGVPEERRPAMMELITRINPDVAVGAFELDLDRGNVSFR
ncbi:MAG: hypothetical protein QOD38_1039, partial [Acidimicrobiaceae bacterium]